MVGDDETPFVYQAGVGVVKAPDEKEPRPQGAGAPLPSKKGSLLGKRQRETGYAIRGAYRTVRGLLRHIRLSLCVNKPTRRSPGGGGPGLLGRLRVWDRLEGSEAYPTCMLKRAIGASVPIAAI